MMRGRVRCAPRRIDPLAELSDAAIARAADPDDDIPF